MEKTFTTSTNKKGFTLAEVLITLGIIGVVAAITIPSLMQNIQDKQFKEAAKTAFSKASQAVQQMRLDNGSSLDGYLDFEKFKPVFMQYFKVAQDCNWQDCVPPTNLAPDNSYIYKTLANSLPDLWFIKYGQFITADGMFWAITNSNSSATYITVDVNGYMKGPNVYGRDVFQFQIKNNNLIPMGGQNTDYTNLSNGQFYCNKNYNSSAQGLGCMDYVMRGIDY